MIELRDLDNLEDTSTLKTVDIEDKISLWEYWKTLLTAKKLRDLEKINPSHYYGFSIAQNINPRRDKHVYTKAENELKKLLDLSKIEYVHELKVKCKNKRLHVYKLDFFLVSKHINIEVSPSFHKTYELVNYRDRLRKRLLKRHGIKVYTIRVFNNGRIDRDYAVRVIKRLKQIPINRNSLEYYAAKDYTKCISVEQNKNRVYKSLSTKYKVKKDV